jgi:nucleoside triphosphate diphosphatase
MLNAEPKRHFQGLTSGHSSCFDGILAAYLGWFLPLTFLRNLVFQALLCIFRRFSLVNPEAASQYSLDDLLRLMARLRDPDDGCPWDLKQDFESITASTLEEAYEVVDAIERRDMPQIRDELGDLLFQIVFYAQLGREQGQFEFRDIVSAITAKLLRRHPHVFPDGTLNSRKSDHVQSEDVKARWEAIKAEERAEKGQGGWLDDVPLNLPSLSRAQKLQKRVSHQGMDFANKTDALVGLRAEIDELEAAFSAQDTAAIADELGDVLFSCVNVARLAGMDAEQLLRGASQKFSRRVHCMERLLEQQDMRLSETSAVLQDSLWQAAKREVG